MTAITEATPLSPLAADLVQCLTHVGAIRATMRDTRATDWPYNSIEAFVLAHGRLWTPTARPPWARWGTPKQCFTNAAKLVIGDWRDDKGLTYVEGYAAIPGVPLPFLHAWCVGPDGVVLDNTLRDLTDADQRAYLGVPFRREYLTRALVRNGTYGLLDVWGGDHNYPLLSGADSVAEAVAAWPGRAR